VSRWEVTCEISGFAGTAVTYYGFMKSCGMWNTKWLLSPARNVGSDIPLMVPKILHCLKKVKVWSENEIMVSVTVMILGNSCGQ
jgi:hypothetical protein